MITLLKYAKGISKYIPHTLTRGKNFNKISIAELRYNPAFRNGADEFGLNILRLNEDGIKHHLLKALNTSPIGQGKSGCVYKIKNTGFALKVPHATSFEKILHKKLSSDISPQEYGNHIRAKLGDDIFIMKYIKGEEIHSQFNVKDFSQQAIKNYLRQIHAQAKNGMKLDTGGKNTKFDPQSGILTAFDFYQNPPGKKFEYINDAFIQTYLTAKNSNDVNELLAKITLAYIDMLKDGTITKSFLSKISTDLGKTKDIIKTNKEFRNSLSFAEETENRLHKLSSLKSLEGLFPQSAQQFQEAAHNFEDFLLSKINIT